MSTMRSIKAAKSVNHLAFILSSSSRLGYVRGRNLSGERAARQSLIANGCVSCVGLRLRVLKSAMMDEKVGEKGRKVDAEDESEGDIESRDDAARDSFGQKDSDSDNPPREGDGGSKESEEDEDDERKDEEEDEEEGKGTEGDDKERPFG